MRQPLRVLCCYLFGHPKRHVDVVYQLGATYRYHCKQCQRKFNVMPPDDWMSKKWMEQHRNG